jgi:hypothetical protein
MINRFYYGAGSKPAPSTVVEQKYALPFGVNKLRFVESRQGLLNKHLLVVTRESRVYRLDQRLFSTRRPDPSMPGRQLFEQPEYPPYQYHIPLQEEAYLSADYLLAPFARTALFHSEFESTSLYLFAGCDLFFLRFSANGVFDHVPQNFSFLLMIAMVTLLTLASLFAAWYLRRQKKILRFMI